MDWQQALYFFLLPSSRVSRSSRASRKMSRSPRLAHKAPVMQARVAIPVDRVILHWFACGADGRRSVGVRSRDYQIFWDG